MLWLWLSAPPLYSDAADDATDESTIVGDIGGASPEESVAGSVLSLPMTPNIVGVGNDETRAKNEASNKRQNNGQKDLKDMVDEGCLFWLRSG